MKEVIRSLVVINSGSINHEIRRITTNDAQSATDARSAIDVRRANDY